MANRSRWQEVRNKRPQASKSVNSQLEQDFALAQMIHDLRCVAGLSQQELAQRMGTTQSAVSRLEEGSVSGNRVDTLARVASALGRHLVISFPEEVPKRLKDAIRVL
jgi:transcriptional regulator with XRE-family HTH domain